MKQYKYILLFMSDFIFYCCAFCLLYASALMAVRFVFCKKKSNFYRSVPTRVPAKYHVRTGLKKKKNDSPSMRTHGVPYANRYPIRIRYWYSFKNGVPVYHRQKHTPKVKQKHQYYSLIPPTLTPSEPKHSPRSQDAATRIRMSN
jgi:hypothetical protein